jgi:hypothetical protein
MHVATGGPCITILYDTKSRWTAAPPTRAVADLFGRRGGPEPGRIGIPCEIA